LFRLDGFITFVEKMLRFRIFKLPRAKQYNYRPVYYDERKEKLANEAKIESYESRIRGSFRRKSSLTDKRDAVKANIRLIVIIAMLTAMALYFLYY